MLVRPASEGNVGAAARAMLNMGLRDLWLVDPRLDRYDPIRWMAHGAEEVVESIRSVATLAEAVADTTVVMATTGRKRRWRSWPIKDPTEAAGVLLESASTSRVAVVFGPEDKGLSNEDLSTCTHMARIPTDAAQTSLNLAQAVLLMAWEIRRHVLADLHPLPARTRVPATADQVDGTIDQLTQVLYRVGYFLGRNELQVRTTARQVLSRTTLTRDEIGFLRGALRKLEWGLENPDKLYD